MFFARHSYLHPLAFCAPVLGACLVALAGCGGGGGLQTPTPVPTVGSGTPTATSSPGSITRQRIAWMSDRTGTFHLYVMNGDGTAQVRLTQSEGQERSPSWSRDGSRRVFSYSADKTISGSEIYSINADGTGLKRLTDNSIEDNSPALSPDGQYVVWAQATGVNTSAIFIARSDGTGQTKLSAQGEFGRTPTFDAQGYIVFASKNILASGNSARYQVVRLNRDGTERTTLTATTSNVYSPSISPDGQTLLYVDDKGGDFKMYSTPVTSFVPRLLPFSKEGDSDPSWTPDGRIVFSSIRDGNPEIYVAPLDGASLKRLTTNSSTDRLPVATGPAF